MNANERKYFFCFFRDNQAAWLTPAFLPKSDFRLLSSEDSCRNRKFYVNSYQYFICVYLRLFADLAFIA